MVKVHGSLWCPPLCILLPYVLFYDILFYSTSNSPELTTSWLTKSPAELPLSMRWYRDNFSTSHIHCTIWPFRITSMFHNQTIVMSCVVSDDEEDEMQTIKMVVVVVINWMHISSCNPFLSLSVHWLFYCPVLHFTFSILLPFLSYDLLTWGCSISYAFLLYSLAFL